MTGKTLPDASEKERNNGHVERMNAVLILQLQVLKKRGILTLIWVVGTAVVAGIIVLVCLKN